MASAAAADRVGIAIAPSDATLGAVVTGVRLADLDDGEWRVIESAFHEHAVLIFPGQAPSAAEQMAFGRRFGVLAIDSLPFSNERDDGSLRPAADPLMRLFRGNEGWHTDSSFQPVSAKASILSARKVPSAGGETEWADMRAAYDALDAEARERIEGLCAYHSLYHSQSTIGEVGETTAQGLAVLHAGDGSGTAGDRAGYREAAEPPLRPLIKVHPVTQRPALYIGRHAYGVPGLPAQDSAELLAGLVRFACRPPRVLTHRWQPGDVVIWDNRCVLHRARPWPLGEPRVMHHTRVAGDPATEGAL
jgi:alpha-ketoglutarate-dependent taurine dioxygenase